jgi:hypothetical protein
MRKSISGIRGRKTMAANNQKERRPGIAVDAAGGSVVDPTPNVLDLVRAESKYQDAMRVVQAELTGARVDGLKELVKVMSDNVVLYQNAQRDAETRRIDELAETRQEFQNTIRDMLAESVRTTSTLVSTQLVQIQATFDTRVSKLEAGAFTAAGRSSVQDPQTADTLSRMASGIAALSTTTTEAMNKTSTATSDAIAKLTVTLASMQSTESGVGGQRKGMQDTNARLLSVVMAVAAVASPVIAILVTIMAMRGEH